MEDGQGRATCCNSDAALGFGVTMELASLLLR